MAEPRILVSCVAAYRFRRRPAGFRRLRRSCRSNGVNLTVFGRFTRFVNMYQTKLLYLGERLEQLRHYDYMLNVDAADTLLPRPLHGIFHYVGDRMLFCAERNCFPFASLQDRMPATGSTYNSLNAGGFLSVMSTACNVFHDRLEPDRHFVRVDTRVDTDPPALVARRIEDRFLGDPQGSALRQLRLHQSDGVVRSQRACAREP